MHGQAMVNTKLTAADCHPNQPDRIEFDMLQDTEEEGKKYFNIHHVGSSKSFIGNKLHVIRERPLTMGGLTIWVKLTSDCEPSPL